MTPRLHAIELVRLWAVCGGGLTLFYALAQIWVDAKTRGRRGRS